MIVHDEADGDESLENRPMESRTATRACQTRIDPHATGCRVAPRFLINTEANGVGLLEEKASTNDRSKAGDTTKRFQAREITAATSQGALTARRSFNKVNFLVKKLVRLFDHPSGALRRHPDLVSRAIATKVIATVATSAAARYPERNSGGQNLCCETLLELRIQLREIPRLANSGTLAFPEETSSDADATLPVSRLFVMLNLVEKVEFAL